MGEHSHYDFPLITMRSSCGAALNGELISIDGERLSGRLLGVRIWHSPAEGENGNLGPDSIFFYVERDEGQMMVPLDQIARVEIKQ
jgi:hypothetical protein